MIEIHDCDHIYVCAPKVFIGGAINDGTVKIHIKAALLEDIEKQARTESVLDAESRGKKAHEFIGSKVMKIEGLKVKGGSDITSYDQLRKTPATELLNWIASAVFSTQRLSEAEIKNS